MATKTTRTPFEELPDSALLRLEEILDLLPVSKASWYNYVSAGVIPKGTKIGPRCTGWPVGMVRKILTDGIDSLSEDSTDD